MDRQTLLISDENCRRLEALIDRCRGHAGPDASLLERLEAEIQKARIVRQEHVPLDLVTMNSVVRLRDLESDEVEVYEVVYPHEADVEMSRVSVLAPLGMALLGYRAGDDIEWPVPAGLRRIHVEQVLYQPETARAVTDAA